MTPTEAIARIKNTVHDDGMSAETRIAVIKSLIDGVNPSETLQPEPQFIPVTDTTHPDGRKATIYKLLDAPQRAPLTSQQKAQIEAEKADLNRMSAKAMKNLRDP